jgi:outer membrane protease
MQPSSISLGIIALVISSPVMGFEMVQGLPPHWAGDMSDAFSYDPAPPPALGNERLRIKLEPGLLLMEANELVYNGNFTVSRLIWQSMAPVLRGSIAASFDHGFSVEVEGSVAGYGRSYMEDYDWLGGDDTPGNWTDRSQHPDTRLDHYASGSLALAYELSRTSDAVVRMHGGFKYTDLQWSAYGGSYVYSSGGFRDDVGDFPDDELSITYRQQIPEVFVGVDGEQRYGNVRLGGLLRGGLTFNSVMTDDHWMRNLRFYDHVKPAPTVALGADVGFALGPMAELFLAARYDRVFEQRADSHTHDGTTGERLSIVSDGGGGDLRQATLTLGLKGQF